jgi:two-component system, OmpR family, phosphate regulon sensor histidine kinase PhoR
VKGLGVRARLFLVSFAIIVGLVVPVGFAVSHQVRGWLIEQTEDELISAAALVQDSLERSAPLTPGDLSAIAHRSAASASMRVTLVESATGITLADSASSGGPMENRAERPEVEPALNGSVGRSARYSTTVKEKMLYVALPGVINDDAAVIRVARPLAHVDDAVRRARLFVVGVGALMILLAATMSALAAQLMGAALRALIDSARAIARGEARQIVVARNDELGGVAGSLNKLASELEETVEALATERARFALVLESMSEAVIALDDRRRVVLHNEAAPALLELQGPIEGRPLIELVRTPALHDLLTDVMDGKPAQAELELPRAQRRVLARATPQRDGSGCVIVMHDVTELRRLETVRRDFVANVSHELRTPVSVIRANAETLLSGAMDDQKIGPALLDALHRNAERLASLVADLLDLSRLEAGRFRLEVQPVAVLDAAQRVRETVTASELGRARPSPSIELDVDREAIAEADPKALDQVLINLVDNAVKYSGDGGRVIVSAHREAENVLIEVIDNGPGVPPAERSRLFERFYRVDPGRSRDMGGTGLGLSIVKHLVESQGGRVGVRAASPQGAIFSVRLPAAKNEPS